MSYRVLLSNQAEKSYKKLQKKVRARVREALVILEKSPQAAKRLHGELGGNYSLRVGKLNNILYFRKGKSRVCDSYRSKKNNLQIAFYIANTN